MKNSLQELTAYQADSSEVALQIAKRILRQPAFRKLRKRIEKLNTPENDFLIVFCSHLARDIIDDELSNFHPKLFPRSCNNKTTSERGKIDGQIAKI